jgi:hypothetical protein
VTALSHLRSLLQNMQGGPIAHRDEERVISALTESWHELTGSTDTKMDAWKITRERPSELRWDPPVLSFVILRHGAMAFGSSAAERQKWEVNLEQQAAHHVRLGLKRLRPRAKTLDIEAIVTKVCEVIRAGSNHDSDLVRNGILVWKSDDECHLKHARLIPADGPKQTVTGRRARLRTSLADRMDQYGWSTEVRQVLVFRRKGIID